MLEALVGVDRLVVAAHAAAESAGAGGVVAGRLPVDLRSGVEAAGPTFRELADEWLDGVHTGAVGRRRGKRGTGYSPTTLEDGTQVTATVQNGWAVAWWPGSHQITSAQLTTPSGTQTQTFPLSPCGLHDCAGGPHGSAPGGGPGGG